MHPVVLHLYREPSTLQHTMGRLGINGVFVAYTLEDVVREGPKVIHETAIPAGVYEVTLTRSARFQRILPEVIDVPGFTGIRFHPGNTEQDTSGCILVGLRRSSGEVQRSREAMDLIQPLMAKAQAAGEPIMLTIYPASAPALNA